MAERIEIVFVGNSRSAVGAIAEYETALAGLERLSDRTLRGQARLALGIDALATANRRAAASEAELVAVQTRAVQIAEQLAGSVGRVNQQLANQRMARQHVQGLTEDYDKLGRTLLRVGGVLSIAPVAATRVFASTERSLGQVYSRTLSGPEERARFYGEAQRLGADRRFARFGAAEAADAMAVQARGGMPASAILGGGAESALLMAGAMRTDAASAARLAVDAMRVFHMRPEQMPHLADQFTVAQQRSNSSFAQMSEAMEDTGSAAEMYGIPSRDALALVTLMGMRNQRGERAGTAARFLIAHLSHPTTQAGSEALERYDLHFNDKHGNLRPMDEIAGELGKLRMLDQEKQSEALQRLFGERGARAARVLMAEGAAGFRAIRDEIDKTGTATRVLEIETDNLQGRWDAMKNAARTAMSDMARQNAPVLSRVLDQATGALGWLVRPTRQQSGGGELARSFIRGNTMLLGPELMAAGAVMRAQAFMTQQRLMQQLLRQVEGGGIVTRGANEVEAESVVAGARRESARAADENAVATERQATASRTAAQALREEARELAAAAGARRRHEGTPAEMLEAVGASRPGRTSPPRRRQQRSTSAELMGYGPYAADIEAASRPVEVPVTVEAEAAQAGLAAVERAEADVEREVRARVVVEAEAAQAELAAVVDAEREAARPVVVPVEVETAQIAAALERVESAEGPGAKRPILGAYSQSEDSEGLTAPYGRSAFLGQQPVEVPVVAEVAPAEQALAQVEAQAQELRAPVEVPVTANIAAARAELEALAATARAELLRVEDEVAKLRGLEQGWATMTRLSQANPREVASGRAGEMAEQHATAVERVEAGEGVLEARRAELADLETRLAALPKNAELPVNVVVTGEQAAQAAEAAVRAGAAPAELPVNVVVTGEQAALAAEAAVRAGAAPAELPVNVVVTGEQAALAAEAAVRAGAAPVVKKGTADAEPFRNVTLAADDARESVAAFGRSAMLAEHPIETPVRVLDAAALAELAELARLEAGLRTPVEVPVVVQTALAREEIESFRRALVMLRDEASFIAAEPPAIAAKKYAQRREPHFRSAQQQIVEHFGPGFERQNLAAQAEVERINRLLAEQESTGAFPSGFSWADEQERHRRMQRMHEEPVPVRAGRKVWTPAEEPAGRQMVMPFTAAEQGYKRAGAKAGRTPLVEQVQVETTGATEAAAAIERVRGMAATPITLEVNAATAGMALDGLEQRLAALHAAAEAPVEPLTRSAAAAATPWLPAASEGRAATVEAEAQQQSLLARALDASIASESGYATAVRAATDADARAVITAYERGAAQAELQRGVVSVGAAEAEAAVTTDRLLAAFELSAGAAGQFDTEIQAAALSTSRATVELALMEAAERSFAGSAAASTEALVAETGAEASATAAATAEASARAQATRAEVDQDAALAQNAAELTADAGAENAAARAVEAEAAARAQSTTATTAQTEAEVANSEVVATQGKAYQALAGFVGGATGQMIGFMGAMMLANTVIDAGMRKINDMRAAQAAALKSGLASAALMQDAAKRGYVTPADAAAADALARKQPTKRQQEGADWLHSLGGSALNVADNLDPLSWATGGRLHLSIPNAIYAKELEAARAGRDARKDFQAASDAYAATPFAPSGVRPTPNPDQSIKEQVLADQRRRAAADAEAAKQKKALEELLLKTDAANGEGDKSGGRGGAGPSFHEAKVPQDELAAADAETDAYERSLANRYAQLYAKLQGQGRGAEIAEMAILGLKRDDFVKAANHCVEWAREVTEKALGKRDRELSRAKGGPFGGNAAETLEGARKLGWLLPKGAEPRPGDVLLKPDHAGVYLGHDQVAENATVHATKKHRDARGTRTLEEFGSNFRVMRVPDAPPNEGEAAEIAAKMQAIQAELERAENVKRARHGEPPNQTRAEIADEETRKELREEHESEQKAYLNDLEHAVDLRRAEVDLLRVQMEHREALLSDGQLDLAGRRELLHLTEAAIEAEHWLATERGEGELGDMRAQIAHERARAEFYADLKRSVDEQAQAAQRREADARRQALTNAERAVAEAELRQRDLVASNASRKALDQAQAQVAELKHRLAAERARQGDAVGAHELETQLREEAARREKHQKDADRLVERIIGGDEGRIASVLQEGHRRAALALQPERFNPNPNGLMDDLRRSVERLQVQWDQAQLEKWVQALLDRVGVCLLDAQRETLNAGR
jgi:TP901 family phage tail tape measure protein